MSFPDHLKIIAQLALMAVAGIMALLSGVAFFPLAGLGLLSLVSLIDEPTRGTATIVVWGAFASFVAIRNTVAFLDLLNDFDDRQWATALAWSLAVIAVCPLWWWWPF